MSVWVEHVLLLIKSDAIRIALIVLLIVGFTHVEILAPAQAGQTVAGRLRNLGYIALFFVLGASGVALLARFLQVQPQLLSVSGWGIVLALLAGLVLSDLLFYWYHRAQHAWVWLWPLHELHHSDTELNVTTSMRSYWLEYPIQVLLIALPVQMLIGVRVQTLAWSMLIMTSWLYFTHTNVRLRLGPLTPLVCGPQVHRIHHSIETKHQNKNFAQFFPVIDILFGTYYAPGHEEFPATGTPALASNASYATTLVRPFKVWFKL
ncbi:MAG TPA: sterol desaturase family protein [Patescibacteria group bacterium]|nr:sterol desaturase family protein [Patescibacteria group bacterium]